MRNRRMLTVTLGIVVALIFGIVVAYAALSSTLNAKFNGVTQSALDWSVRFYTEMGPINGVSNGTSSEGLSCGTAAQTANGITVDSTTVSKPGDSCTYNFEIVNAGDIVAKLSSITALKPNGVTCSNSSSNQMVCGNITYTLTGLTTNMTIEKRSNTYMPTKQKASLVVSYTGTGLSSTTTTQSGGGFQVVFAQA